MLKVLKKELNISIITSLVYIALGIVIILNPETIINMIGTIIAVLAISYGVIMTIINLVNIKEETSLVFGVFAIVLGIALLIYPSSLSVLLSLGIGIWFIASSITRLKFAIILKGVPELNWAIILISSLLTLVVGISFIFTPLASAVAITTLSGIMMVVYSVIDLFEIIFIKIHIKQIEEVLE